MDAAAESQVWVRVPGDVERVRLGEHLGVARRGPEQGGHLPALGDPVSGDLDVGGGGALEQLQWRVVPDQLLGGRGDERGVTDPGDQPVPLPAVGQQGVHTVTEHVDRGLVPGHEQQHRRGHHLVPGEVTGHEVTEQVVAGIGGPVPGQCAQVVGELGGRPLGGEPPVVRQAVLVHLHDGVAPPHHRGTILGGHPQQFGDHRHRERLGEVLEQVGLAVAGDAVGEGVHHPFRERLDGGPQPFHVPAGEGGRDQPPQPGVCRWLVLQQGVAVQHVERGEPLHRGRVAPEAAQAPVAQHRGRGRMGDRDRQAQALVVVDVALGAQPGELRIRVGEEARIGGIEHPQRLTRRDGPGHRPEATAVFSRRGRGSTPGRAGRTGWSPARRRWCARGRAARPPG